MTLKFSDLTPSDLAVLRVDAALEDAYPVKAEGLGRRRSSVVLAGHEKWKLATSGRRVTR